MSTVKIQGHASGSGTLTIGAPNTDSNRTITLPDTTGTLLDENSSVPAANLTGTVADARVSALTASKLTGALPAISGANLTNLVTTLAGSTDATVSASDPTTTSNPSAVGHLWLNSTSGEAYICTTATNNANVWTNIGPGTGDVPFPYAIEYLVVGGGAGGGPVVRAGGSGIVLVKEQVRKPNGIWTMNDVYEYRLTNEWTV